MNEVVFDKKLSIPMEQKHLALDAILRSNTFARADQLKTFLRYVCEKEIAGQGHELTEYLIGIEALGRPSNYSPGDDSGVRNRAFALRKKLQEYYEHEQPDAVIRIELLKGSYCPHFVECQQPPKSNGTGALIAQSSAALIPVAPPDDVVSLPELESKDRKKGLLLSFLCGVIASAMIAAVIYQLAKRNSTTAVLHQIAPIVAEAWGPILSAKSDALVCVANPPNLSVHPATSGVPSTPTAPPQFNDPGGRPLPKELQSWYQQRYPSPANQSLFLTITTNATYWGDSIGAMMALKTMISAGMTPQIFPEKVVTVPTLRHRNVVLFGAPEYSPAVAHFLEKCPLTVSYLNSIISRNPEEFPSSKYTTKRDDKNRLIQVYGLITVLPSESSSDLQHQTLIFSGVNSAGAQAAAEFFCTPEHLIELRKHLKEEGHDKFPSAYQVAVSAETDDNILLNFKYETHRVIRR